MTAAGRAPGVTPHLTEIAIPESRSVQRQDLAGFDAAHELLERTLNGTGERFFPAQARRLFQELCIKHKICTFHTHNVPHEIDAIVDLDDVVTCLPVVQEVLQGFRDEGAFRVAQASMLSFPMVESPLQQQVVLEAVALYRSARRSGVTVRSSIDCLIAACALRHDLEIVHRDRDYPALARVSALRQRGI